MTNIFGGPARGGGGRKKESIRYFSYRMHYKSCRCSLSWGDPPFLPKGYIYRYSWCTRKKHMHIQRLKKKLHLRTYNFFPKEANSASLAWGETRKSLITLVLRGSWMFSLSCGANKLIFKTIAHKKAKKGQKDIKRWAKLSILVISIQSLENFTLVSSYGPAMPESLRATIVVWLWTSTSKNRAPSMCKSVCEDHKHYASL